MPEQQVGSDDIPRLLEIRRAAFAAHAPSAYSPAEVETLLGDVDPAELAELIGAGRLFVTRRAGEIVGLAGWQGDNLRHVYVDPAHTRRGIASGLLAVVEADFHTRTGKGRIFAGVALHARAFYLANGYSVVERATAWDGSGYLRMVKELPGRPRPAASGGLVRE